MQTGKLIRIFMVLALLALVVAPTAVFASFDGKDNDAASNAITYQHDGEEEESQNEEDSHGEEEAATSEEEMANSDGVGFTLGFLAGIIFLIIAVVAIVSAVGLGLIGLGYWQSSSGED